MAAPHGKLTRMCQGSFLRILPGVSYLRGIATVLVSKQKFVGLSTDTSNFASLPAVKENRAVSYRRDVLQPTPNINVTSDSQPNTNPLHHSDYFDVHRLVKMKELFNARVHLGHHEGCWNPLMKPYLIGTHEHYHVIDLNETVRHLKHALNVLCHIVYEKGRVLFISTHPQFEKLVQQTARDSGEFFITSRWRGGTFTNSYMMIGTRQLPDLVIFLNLPSLGRNQLAVKEAAQCNIPSIGIIDTDCNPNLIMYPVPGNDDSPSAVELYCKIFKEAILKAKKKSELKYRRGRKEQIEEMEEVPKQNIQLKSEDNAEGSELYN